VSQATASHKTSVEAAFTNVTAGHMITAIFVVDTYKITASAGAGGAISPSGSVNINYGANQSFTITASPGYRIVDLIVDGASTAVPSHATTLQADFNKIRADHTISAVFALNY